MQKRLLEAKNIVKLAKIARQVCKYHDLQSCVCQFVEENVFQWNNSLILKIISSLTGLQMELEVEGSQTVKSLKGIFLEKFTDIIVLTMKYRQANNDNKKKKIKKLFFFALFSF